MCDDLPSSGPRELANAVRRTGVGDERLLAAIEGLPREWFVPIDLAGRAYLDAPLPIPHDQVTTQPSLSARMIEALELEGSEQVLEIGTGYGFQTGLLARLAGFVWSVERWPDLAEAARENLAAAAIENVEVVVGDGTRGLPGRDPFDAILVSAAFPEVPAPLAAQLAEGGRLVQPIGSGGAEQVLLFRKLEGRLERIRFLTGAFFVRLYGEHGFDSGEW
jgi:protein-L-isoaspartate(D-aspartate) O-methyltransferase